MEGRVKDFHCRSPRLYHVIVDCTLDQSQLLFYVTEVSVYVNQKGHIAILVFTRLDSGYFRAFRFLWRVCVCVCGCARVCVCARAHIHLCIHVADPRHIITISIPTSEQLASLKEGFFTLLRA